MRREEHVDYFLVSDEQLGIHRALENWSRWVRVRPHGWQVSPMFRQYRSHAWQWHAPAIRTPVDMPAAVAMEKAVSGLPEKHRTAIRWCYVMAGHPAAMARSLGVSKQGLMDLIVSARTMLRNRVG
jgi:DNA-directed RNA polymerase specialized sigma24 family protein